VKNVKKRLIIFSEETSFSEMVSTSLGWHTI
jgi:hypothetical protein